MATDKSILVVEDEQEIAELILLHLERAGFSSTLVSTGEAAIGHLEKCDVDLVLLDLMLPGIDGFEVCRRMKWEPRTRQIPIIMLTACGEETDIVCGLELGADDYIVKPFSAGVLVARVRSVLRRGADFQARATSPNGGMIQIDADRFEVRVEGSPIKVTAGEYQILKYLASRPGFVRTRQQIIEATHGKYVVMSSRTIDVHITALRRKLGKAGVLIETIRGVGYRLEEDFRAEST
ncbi:MAG: response regulator transcription factor [Phycisphaerales bacterium]|nr:response regulator transcription factor [Phycisphaerales bacterium]